MTSPMNSGQTWLHGYFSHLCTVKSVITPSAARTLLSLTDGELLAGPIEYQSMVGALQYLTMTHPDIAYMVHGFFQFIHALHITHLHAIKCIFRYLQGIQAHDLLLRPSTSPCLIIAYSDDNCTGCKDSCCSTTGYVVYLGPNLITWRSKKQPTV